MEEQTKEGGLLLNPTYPIPEAIDQKPWEIVGGEAVKRMMEQHKLVLPLSPDLHDMVVRTHELGHVRFSPAKAPKELNPAILNVVEDARVNGLLLRGGVRMDPGYPPALVNYTVEKLLQTKDRMGAVLFSVGMLGMPGGEEVRERLAPVMTKQDWEAVQRVKNTLCKRLDAGCRHDSELSFAGFTVPFAKYLQTYFDEERRAQEQKKEEEQQQRQAQQRANSYAEKKAEEKWSELLSKKRKVKGRYGDEEDDEEVMQKVRAQAEAEAGPGTPFVEWLKDHRVPWGKMTIEEPPRVQQMPGRFGRRRRPSDIGAALVYPQRLWQDMRVFGRRLRSYGASVLVDGSGSMSLSHAQIWEILKNAPGATVAIYGGPDVRHGVLKILARKGLVVAEKDAGSPGPHNIVDGVALEWLARQDEPRIWVSDALVTGVDETFSEVNQAECLLFCKQRRILRLPYAHSAVRVLTDLRNRRMGVVV